MAVAALAPVLFLTALIGGWLAFQDGTGNQPTSETTASTTDVPVPPLPREDAPGKELPGLPRYPDSVRIGYERAERDGLVTTKARYLLVGEKTDTVRGFYRGVFGSEGWTEGDAHFSGGAWTFFVTHDQREATVVIEPRDPNTLEVEMRLSEPQAESRLDERPPQPAPPVPDTPSQAQYAPVPAPTPPPQYGPQTPHTPAPAPSPVPAYGGDDDDGYYDDDDLYGGEDYGDD